MPRMNQMTSNDKESIMSKRGRPRIPESENRSIARLILFNERENNMLLDLADQNAVSMATIVRYGVAVLHGLQVENVSTASVEQFQ